MADNEANTATGSNLYRAAFHGDRFPRDLGMVAPALTELVAIEEVTRRLARLIARRRRGSVPKGFDEKFEMRVNGFGPGSKVAMLERTTPNLQLVHQVDEFDQAEDVIAAAHQWANDQSDEQRALPHIAAGDVHLALKWISRLGRTLLPGEHFEYGRSGVDLPIARCSRRSHFRLLDLSEPTTMVRDTVLIGRVISQNYEMQTLAVKPVLGPQVIVDLNGPIDIDILGPWSHGETDVVVRGAGYYRDGSTLKEVREPESIVAVSPRLGTPKRFTRPTFDSVVAEVQQRGVGWLDGESGDAPDLGMLDAAVATAREAREKFRVDYPIVGSTGEGAITFDWKRAPYRLGAEFDRETGLVEMYCVNTVEHQPAAFASCPIDSPVLASEIAAFVNWVEQ